jgi:hypothetical protein
MGRKAYAQEGCQPKSYTDVHTAFYLHDIEK